MKVDMDMNRVLGRQPGPLTDRERAVRRLRESTSTVEVLAGGEGLTITNFVFDFNVASESVLEYFCSTCGAHVLAYYVKVRGVVTCACGLMTGKRI